VFSIRFYLNRTTQTFLTKCQLKIIELTRLLTDFHSLSMNNSLIIRLIGLVSEMKFMAQYLHNIIYNREANNQ
jgi:hypothetical protein